jgi:hypothetical protein
LSIDFAAFPSQVHIMRPAIGILAGAIALVIFALPLAAQDVTDDYPQLRRQLAPGVLTVIPPEPLPHETFQGPMPIVELQDRAELQWGAPEFPEGRPHFTSPSQTLQEMAKEVFFRREIWNLEFAFKPMRLIEVDIPQPDGRLQRKLIWYMVYRITYRGGDLRPSEEVEEVGSGAYQTSRVRYPEMERVNYEYRRFFPHFVLETRQYDKEYLDRVIPAAKMPILLREFPSGEPGVPELPPEKFYNSVEMTQVRIPRSDERTERSVWGFVTWEDVDPRIDFFSLYVRGLTNAFRFEDAEGPYRPEDPPGAGRTFEHKTLQLNFYRPGDHIIQDERQFRFGIPVVADQQQQERILDMYGVEERVDHLWVYR